MALSEQDAIIGQGMAAKTLAPPARREVIYRHSLVVRLTHWINVLCLTLLLMSGLAVFNVHPRSIGAITAIPACRRCLSITGRYDPETAQPVGTTRIGDYAHRHHRHPRRDLRFGGAAAARRVSRNGRRSAAISRWRATGIS